jgi:hypothetical protein
MRGRKRDTLFRREEVMAAASFDNVCYTAAVATTCASSCSRLDCER